MTADVENLLLEHMKRFQATLERIESELREVKMRMTNIENGQVSFMKHLAHQAAAHASQQVVIDRMNDRLDRIERRLELSN